MGASDDPFVRAASMGSAGGGAATVDRAAALAPASGLRTHAATARPANTRAAVDMIVQNTGADGLTDFTFTVKRGDYERALEILEPVRATLGARELAGDNKITKVSVVGGNSS